MNIADTARFFLFACFGVGVAFMAVTNVLAYFVLRVRQKLGFLWWHVTSVSVSFLCISIVDLHYITGHFGRPFTRWTFLTGAGLVLFMFAQIIIFNVERRRYATIKMMLDTESPHVW